ncbi:SDR family oxidoreductase [Luminiphilus sp.]|nr:SDR family oxidoreductase [Luminiphilus sp.]MDA8986212.1 SDR family oxidoreductase [Luminiphilus sp.]
MDDIVIVTGSNGDIGRAISEQLMERGCRVVGVDLRNEGCRQWETLIFDLEELSQKDAEAKLGNLIQNQIKGGQIIGLVNNAALQIVKPWIELESDDVIRSLIVNSVAPFVLSKFACRHMPDKRGVIVNIGSIHSRLTKPGFVAYATSKAALEGLTRSMAVELGSRIRVGAIFPAAIETQMLKAGLAHEPESYAKLSSYHPTGKIGNVDEVACLVSALIRNSIPFASGALWNLDGGIGCRLHDPS